MIDSGFHTDEDLRSTRSSFTTSLPEAARTPPTRGSVAPFGSVETVSLSDPRAPCNRLGSSTLVVFCAPDPPMTQTFELAVLARSPRLISGVPAPVSEAAEPRESRMLSGSEATLRYLARSRTRPRRSEP